MNVKAFLNTVSLRCRTLPIVILYVTEGCNLQCITCSYRDPLPNELTLDEIKQLAGELSRYGLRHIVYSGGEPLMRKDFVEICRIFSDCGVKQSLLTNGLLLEKRVEAIAGFLDEIIVSVDGPTADIHNSIRGARSFDVILNGIHRYMKMPDRKVISLRCVVQKRNFRLLQNMVSLAKSLGVNSISFLSADVLSDSFARDTRGKVALDERITLTENETIEFRRLTEQFVVDNRVYFESGLLSDPPQKFFHMVQYFEALVGKTPFPRNHCNAPMVSAVITSTGQLLPCFFLPSYGNIRQNKIKDLFNTDGIRRTRNSVRRYELERCRTCVCTMNKTPTAALMDRF
ncbi:MAG: Radical protein [Bacteroidetes bacterium]|nr:Radical protein [Bacteroidota bacterium]